MGQSFSTQPFVPVILTENFTSATTGAIQNISPYTATIFSIQVIGVGANPDDWKVSLEGSLDGTSFTRILTHTIATGASEILYSNSGKYSSVFFRINVTSLTLGSATAINVIVTATN